VTPHLSSPWSSQEEAEGKGQEKEKEERAPAVEEVRHACAVEEDFANPLNIRDAEGRAGFA
jgi:hypothetical protein